MPDSVSPPAEVLLGAPSEHSRRQLEALLQVSEAIAQQRDLPALFHELAERLHSVIDFDFLALVLHDAKRNVMRLHVLESRVPHENAGQEKKTGSESVVEGEPSGWVWQTQQTFVVQDMEGESRFPEFMKRMREAGVRSMAVLPLTTAQRRLGAMAFGRMVPLGLTQSAIDFMSRVASQVAVAVDNALNFETAQSFQQKLAHERDRLQVLLQVNNVLVTTRELPELFRGIVATVERVIQLDYTSLALLDPASGLLKIYALNFPGHEQSVKTEMTVPLAGSPAGQAISTGAPVLLRGEELDRYPTEVIRILRSEGMQSIYCVPLVNNGRTFC